MPLIEPGKRYILKMNATPNQGRGSGGEAWLPLDDVDGFIRDRPGAEVASYARWLDDVIVKFDAWCARIRAAR